jgi:8-amino-7-oxononanoate synthase
VDIFNKANQYTTPAEAARAGLYPCFLPFDSAMAPLCQTDGRQILMFGSNNYLGLTEHQRVIGAAREALERYGTSCTGSRLANGTLGVHRQLEEELAAFFGKERALVFTTGYQANIGSISALAGHNDVVITDRRDHASIIDGARLGRGIIARYRHNDLDHLEQILAFHAGKHACLIVVDGVFSMEGDLAPLREICDLKNRFGARLAVDDAHGIGVLGKTGRGTCEHLGVLEDVDLVTGTFSKSLASIGGFIAGPAMAVDYISHRATAMVFSASASPACVAAATAALQVIVEEPERRDHLRASVARLRDGLRRMNLEVGDSPAGIVPIFVRNDWKALAVWRSLFDSGLYVNPAIPPAVEPGSALLRASCMATHTAAHIDKALAVFGHQASAWTDSVDVSALPRQDYSRGLTGQGDSA